MILAENLQNHKVRTQIEIENLALIIAYLGWAPLALSSNDRQTCAPLHVIHTYNFQNTFKATGFARVAFGVALIY